MQHGVLHGFRPKATASTPAKASDFVWIQSNCRDGFYVYQNAWVTELSADGDLTQDKQMQLCAALLNRTKVDQLSIKRVTSGFSTGPVSQHATWRRSSRR